MTKSYPGIAVYYGEDEQAIVNEIEAMAKERGVSLSFFMRRCSVAGLAICKLKANKNTMHPKGMMELDLVPVQKIGRRTPKDK